MTKGIQKQIGILPAIEAEAHFVEIGRQMLCGNPMPCADDAALQERESRFNRVRVNVAINVDLGFVLNRFVLRGHGDALHCRRVGVEFVGHDYIHIFANVLSDELRQCAALNVLSMEEPEIAATLTDADNNLFVGVAVPCLAVGVLLAADVGFVHFDSTVQHGPLSFFHGSTNAMAQVPRGLVADSQGTFDLIGGHSLTCFAEQQNRHEPLLQGQVGVVKDSSSGHRELIVAFFAVQEPRIQSCKSGSVAPWAFRIAGPAQPLQQFTAFFVGIEQFNHIRESHREHPN